MLCIFPNPAQLLELRIRILLSSSKNIKENLYFYLLFCDLYDFLALKNDVNLSTKVINTVASWRSMMKRAGYGAGSGSGSPWYGSADPDPYLYVTDLEHWFYDIIWKFSRPVSAEMCRRIFKKHFFIILLQLSPCFFLIVCSGLKYKVG